MPPITSTPQNSRATLVTWLVVFVILFVAASVFAIYYDVQWNKTEQSLSSLTSKYKVTVTDADLVTPELSTIKARPGQSAVMTLITQRKAASRLVTGNEQTAPEDLATTASTTLRAVETQLKAKGISATLPDNLLQAIRTLGDQVAANADASAKALADAKAARDEATRTTQERERLLADKDKQIALKDADLKKAVEEIATYHKTLDEGHAELAQNAQHAIQEANQARTALQTALSSSQQKNNELQDNLRKTQAKFDRLRLNPNESMQQADGIITQVSMGAGGEGTVFINLGQSDSVTPGLTFEVYDSHRGLPKLTSPTTDSNGNDTDLPAGKASIEVIRVLPGNTSLCRIIKTAPGQFIARGDLIENLVYDPHTKYNFYVFGSFDVSQTGTANPNDAELIRRLVTQWGGKLQDTVNVDTDFVVLGKEPAVPTLSDEDKNNPIAVRRQEEALKAYQAYLDIKANATQLRIPILNQNRFLYFTGYYDQAKR